MIELSPLNARTWLRVRGIDAENAQVTELGGGISNKVLLVERPGLRAVIKQSLGKLRVEQEWLSDRERIFREAAAMRWLSGRVRGGRVPSVLAEDASEFAILMDAAPGEAEMWKTQLMRGETDARTARAAGELLASIISAGWHDAEAAILFGDQTVFDQLRIDPYYRVTASRHPAIAPYIAALIAASSARRVSLVHGDWSPKNLLVAEGELWAIDWEVVHFGDPSFDVAFLWNHLLMKSIALPQFRARYAELATIFTEALTGGLPEEAGWVRDAALEHLAALLLARVDGKSPAEYLDGAMRGRARALALGMMKRPARSIEEAFER